MNDTTQPGILELTWSMIVFIPIIFSTTFFSRANELVLDGWKWRDCLLPISHGAKTVEFLSAGLRYIDETYGGNRVNPYCVPSYVERTASVYRELGG